jgi:hypothetical protein
MKRGTTARRVKEALRASEQDSQLDELWTQLERASTYEAPQLIRRMLQAAKSEGRQEVVKPLNKMKQAIGQYDTAAEKVERILGD